MKDWSPKNLLKKLNLGESRRVEAKLCVSGVGDSCLQTICAFANEPGQMGGYILLGVKENRGRFAAVGVSDQDKIQNEIFCKIRDRLNVSPKIESQVGTIDGKVLVALCVHELDRGQKPCEFVGKFDGKCRKSTGVWRRHLSGDYECDTEALRELILEREGFSFEEVVLPDAEMGDIDEEMVSRYRVLREKVHPSASELQGDDVALLRALSAIKKNDSGVFVPTVAGLLLFGKKTALRRLLPSARVDYIRLPGDSWLADPDKRFEYTMDSLEPLLTLLPRLEALVMDDIPKSFSLKDGDLQRADIPILPQRVMREALVNALMHRDYRVNQPTQILRFPGRIEIVNAGRSLKPVHLLGENGSILRNPRIASVLYDLKFAETKGSGVALMRNLLKSHGFSLPEFSSDVDENMFHAQYFLHQFFGEGELSWLRGLGMKLSEDKAKVLILAKKDGRVTSRTLREVSGLDTLKASRVFYSLCRKGLLDKFGVGAGTYYTLSADVAAKSSGDNDLPKKEFSGGDGAKMDIDGAKMDIDGAKMDIDGAKMDIVEKVLSFCRTPRTAREIMNFIGKSYHANSLKRYLHPLLEQGVLLRTVPDKPTSKGQRYINANR